MDSGPAPGTGRPKNSRPTTKPSLESLILDPEVPTIMARHCYLSVLLAAALVSPAWARVDAIEIKPGDRKRTKTRLSGSNACVTRREAPCELRAGGRLMHTPTGLDDEQGRDGEHQSPAERRVE